MFLLPTQQIIQVLNLGLRTAQIDGYDQELIPVGFCYPNYDCHYTSAIAHQLRAKLQKSSQEIAQTLQQAIPSNSQLEIAATDRGMLNFRLTDSYIQTCLKHLAIANLKLNYIPNPQDFPQFTHTQYAYARCCSLLRLASTAPHIFASSSSLSLGLNLIAIAESLTQLSHSQIIKLCQRLSAIFLESSDRSELSISLNILSLQVTQKLLQTLASGYIKLPEYL